MADEYLTAALYGMKRFNEGVSKKVKELMGMEKLIKLLNEYCGGGEWTIECDVPHNVRHGDYAYEDEVPIIISKQYGFIKWLVENNKVTTYPLGFHCEIDLDFTERALMLLSIQDEPIEFLISILK